jgi:predicted HTH transcriptional regulator
MIPNLNEIMESIRLGEDTGAEFKEVFFSGNRVTDPSRDRLAKELAAMANAKGGWLILGINDKSRRVVGISADKLDAVEELVRNVCHDSIKPELPVDIYRRELADEDGALQPVVLVGVEQGLYVHQAPEGYFRRTGSSARPMTTDYVVRLHQERSLVRIKRFEELPVPGSTIADLDPDLWKRFVSSHEIDRDAALIKRNLLARAESGELRASVLGVLMCSDSPRKFLPNAFIQAVRYRGVVQDSHHQVDAKDLEGPLDRQIRDAMTFFRLNQRVAAQKELGRAEVAQFSERAVFEAIVNAVAHRDYSVDHSKIRLFMFDDRIELYSPGGLVNSMSVDSLPLRTATRNERITNLLAECPVPDAPDGLGRQHLMERRGDGVNIILRESEALSGRKPEYRLIDDAELSLTIFAAELPNQENS